MQRTRGSVLVVGLVFGITLGAPVALSGVDAPVATTALSLFVDDAAAQGFEVTETFTGENCGQELNNCFVTDNEGGAGGRGGNGGLAMLHEAITTSAASETSPSLSDLQTGFIHNDMTIVIEDTDETVVINNAGNPGSTGIHTQIIGAPSQAINTGSNTGSADASGGPGGDGGSSDIGDITQVELGLPLRGGLLGPIPLP